MGRNRYIKLAVAIAVAAGTVPLSYSVHAQDTSIDRHLAMDQALNYGRGISESALGGRLAWGESYYLDSYMTMYEATRNPFYLDNSDSDGIPDGWNRQGAANGAYRTDAAGASFEGLAAAVLESDGAGENRLVQTLNYFPNATYEVEAFMSVDDEASEPLIEVYNASTNKVLASVRAHHIGYERYLLTFKAPASGNLQLRLSLQDYMFSGYKGYIDNVSVKPVHDIQVVPIDNGNMEALDAADPTLPANWTRFAASNASNVYASTDSYSGAYSMAVTTDNTSWEAAEQVIDYVPSRSYTLKFVGKVSSSAAYGRMQILNETDNVSLGNTVISYADWTTASVTFTAPPAAGKVLKIRLLQNIWSVPGFTSYFDDLVMYESFPSTERVANPSFETVDGTDGTLPLNWTRTAGSTSAEVYGSSGIDRYYTGTRGIALASSASGTVGIEQSVAYTPGETYVLSFRGRTTRPDAAGTVELYNETAAASIAAITFAGTIWKKQSIVFTAPSASGQTLKLRALMPPTSTGEVGYVDVVSLKPLEYAEAAGWTRDAGTSLAAAHRSNDAVRFPADDAGLELIHDGTADPIVYQEIYNYAPNARYIVCRTGIRRRGGRSSNLRSDGLYRAGKLDLQQFGFIR